MLETKNEMGNLSTYRLSGPPLGAGGAGVLDESVGIEASSSSLLSSLSALSKKLLMASLKNERKRNIHLIKENLT